MKEPGNLKTFIIMLLELKISGKKSPNSIYVNVYDIKFVDKTSRITKVTIEEPSPFPPFKHRKEFKISRKSWQQAESYMKKFDHIKYCSDKEEEEDED